MAGLPFMPRCLSALPLALLFAAARNADAIASTGSILCSPLFSCAMDSCHRKAVETSVALRVRRSVALRVRRTTVPVLALDVEDDTPRMRFKRSDEETRTSFVPGNPQTQRKEDAGQPTSKNEALLAEIQALMPPTTEPAPEKMPVDLNGIRPRDLVIGAFSYAVVCVLAWQFTIASGTYFAEHPAEESSFYVVNRLTGLARVVVVSMGALGAGVTGIASVGQAALAVQVAMGVMRGELDPTRERVLTAKRKATNVEQLFAMMSGKGKQSD